MKRGFKVVAVIFGAVIVTTLSIDATDTLSGKSGTLLGQLAGIESNVCPSDMVEVPGALTFTCVDIFEAAPGPECPVTEPTSADASQDNINALGCRAVSDAKTMPWRYVTREQAEVACARAGKRLPNAAEWYEASLGTVGSVELCNLDSKSAALGEAYPDCRSAAGARHMVGNVWEWVRTDITDGEVARLIAPGEGYVAAVMNNGLPAQTTDEPNRLFGDDYFWSTPQGTFAVLRGGYYGSQTDGGVFATHAKNLSVDDGPAIGFRCIR